MKDNREELELDRYIEQLDKKEIEVPRELEVRILNRISQVEFKPIKPLKTGFVRVFVAAAAILTLFTASVKWIPGFAASAAAIPVVKYAVEWIKGDSGTELAKKEGYLELDPVTVEQNGYKLVIDNIMFDEDRLALSVYAYGKKIEELLPEANINASAEEVEDNRLKPEPHVSLQFFDFRESGYIGIQNSPDDSVDKALKLRAEKIFEESEVKDFLAKQPMFLTISAEITLRNPDGSKEVLQSFENVKITLDREKILMSKVYEVKQSVQIDKALVTLDRLTISPTRMRVDASFDLPEGYFFTDFINPYIKDSKGNIYKPEGLISTNVSETSRRLFFVPSVFFDDSHNQLFFGFDGIRIGAKEGKSFTISMSETYPKIIKYMGEEIVIEKVTYSKNKVYDPLEIQLQLPRSLSIEGLDIKGSKGRSHGKAAGLDENGKPHPDICGANIEYRPEYEAEFAFPGYLINETKVIPIKLR